jgi:hypothetical protein
MPLNRIAALLVLTLSLSLAACGEDSPDPGNPGTGSPATTSHLGGTAPTHGACDNPSDSPRTCYGYEGNMWADGVAATSCADLKGTYSSTQGCSASGRGGRCSLFEDTANAYVAHCYFSTSECQRICDGVGTFTAN